MRQVLWSATLRRNVSIKERIDVAAGAGFAAVSLFHDDFLELGSDPRKAQEIVAYATDSGVALSVMDGSSVWYPIDESRPLRSAPVGFEVALAAAEAFGCTMVSAVPGFATQLDVAGLAEHFAIACDAARDRGLRVQLEFGPVPPVKGLAAGWGIVQLADRPNGSLVFDTWHFFRGGPDFDLLEAIQVFLGSIDCVFIVAADQELIGQGLKARFKDLVESAQLERDQEFYARKGREYFEKIIQFGIPVPEAGPNEGYRFIGAHFPQWAASADLIIAAIAANPRRLKQYVGLLEYRYGVATSTPDGVVGPEGGTPTADLRRRLTAIRWRDPKCAEQLRTLMESNGFTTLSLRHMNPAGAWGYRFKQANKTNYSKTFSPAKLKLVNSVIPLLSLLDHVPGLKGLSLIGAFRRAP